MNSEFRKTLWRSHIQSWAMVAAGILAGAVCVWLARQILGDELGRLMTGILFLTPIVLYLGITALRTRSLRYDSGLCVISLDQFLATPEATFAPNYPEVSRIIRDWLSAFALKHGEQSVFVGIQTGEEHLCDVVYLLVPALTAEDRTALDSLRIAGLKQLSLKALPDVFRQTKPSAGRVYEVVWD